MSCSDAAPLQLVTVGLPRGGEVDDELGEPVDGRR